MPKTSAGILFYRYVQQSLQVLLVHPGGPYWAKKDRGAWSIPKGEVEEGETPQQTALREAGEELGITINGNMLPLDSIKQKSGKVVYAWAVEQDIDTTLIKSNQIEIEWPPRSGQLKPIPEIDRAEWFDIPTANQKMIAAQVAFIHALQKLIGG